MPLLGALVKNVFGACQREGGGSLWKSFGRLDAHPWTIPYIQMFESWKSLTIELMNVWMWKLDCRLLLWLSSSSGPCEC